MPGGFQESEAKVNNKKSFNKKKWREKKYSNKAKREIWEEKRKKAALRKYHKELKKDGLLKNEKDNVETDESGTKTQIGKRYNPFQAAQLKFEKIQEEKRKLREEQLKRKQEIKEAIERHKKNRLEKLKKLSKKTKKGQPLMKNRIEMLYEKLKSSLSK